MNSLTGKIKKAILDGYVGNVIFTEEEQTILYQYTAKILRIYENQQQGKTGNLPNGTDLWCFVAMVEAAKNWSSDENAFWPYILNKLIGCQSSQKIYSYLTDVIDKLGQKGYITCFKTGKVYYSTILLHAFSPIISIEAFFELCWKIYSVDINFTYRKDDQIFALVAFELQQALSKDVSFDQDFQIGSQAYSLRSGIKKLALEYPEKMIELIERTINLIDRTFNGEILSDEDYYSFLFHKWWMKKEEEFGKQRPKIKAYDRAVDDYTMIRPLYFYKDGQAFLKIPSIRLKDRFDEDLTVIVQSNEEKPLVYILDTFGSGLAMATKEKWLQVNELLSDEKRIHFSVTILHGNQTIYRSNNKLKREYILFREGREIMAEECCPGNYFLFAPMFDLFSDTPCSIRKTNPNTYTFYAEEGEILRSIHKTVFFALEKQNREVKIAMNKKANAKFIRDGEEYSVIDGDLKIIVNKGTEISNYGIRYDDVIFKLQDLNYVETEKEKEFILTDFINVCEPQKICIFNFAKNQIEMSFNIIKFNNIQISFDKKLYYDEDIYHLGCVQFKTEKYDKTVEFDINHGDVLIPFDDGDVIVTPPILRWKITGQDFCCKYVENIWYKTVPNNAELLIEVPMEMGYSLVLNTSEILQRGKAFHQFLLGETIYSKLDTTNEFTVIIQPEGIPFIPICQICLKEKFKSCPIEINGDLLIWNPSDAFVGDKGTKFKIVLSNTENRTITWNTTLQKESFDLKNVETGIYQITIFAVKGGFLGREEQIYQTNVTYGDVNEFRFRKKKIICSDIMLTGAAETTYIKQFYIDRIEYMGILNNEPTYVGQLYIINRYGNKIYLNQMADEYGQYITTNPVRITWRSENTCYLVAGVNPTDMEDFWGEFSLNYHNQASTYSKNAKGIDYYIFKTEKENV